MTAVTNLHTIELFTQFFQENQVRFLSFACSYLRDKAEAEDILMESMITLWENREKWEESSNLQALLLTIIRNKALNHLAHEQVRLRAEEEINTQATRTRPAHFHLRGLRTQRYLQHRDSTHRRQNTQPDT